jgi:hypothetical protein
VKKEVKQVQGLVWHKERVKEYGRSINVFMYENGTMRPVKTILRIKENDGVDDLL